MQIDGGEVAVSAGENGKIVGVEEAQRRCER
jgi:hypothetical protein